MPEGVEQTRTCEVDEPFGALPVPTCQGYIFIGWFSSEEALPEEEVTEDTIAPEEDMTIYASWLPVTY